MNSVTAFLETTSEAIARCTAKMGKEVALDASVLDRSDSFPLAAPGLWSANRSCRLIKAKDGWIAANLPREEDRQSVPALLQAMPENDPWDMLVAQAPLRSCAELIAQAELIGLALAGAGETPPQFASCMVEAIGSGRKITRNGLRVVDLSSLWAGPLCGSVLAAMGADVLKIESVERPDPTPHVAPLLDRRLNGQKQRKSLSLSSKDGVLDLLQEITQCDVLITSARARALEALDLTRERLFALNPALIWVAITGHGWSSNRIAFGDDAAASGGLLHWDQNEPRFLGDALADPLTGLAAASCALAAFERGGGAFIDAALARTAAYVAAGGARPR